MTNITKSAFCEPFPVGTKVKATNPNHPTYVGWIKRYVYHDDPECGNCVMVELVNEERESFQNFAAMLQSGRLSYYKLEAV